MMRHAAKIFATGAGLSLGLGLLLVAGIRGRAEAAVSPQKINFQGKLLDTSNNPKNGSFDFTFRIYGLPEGGTSLWEEQQGGVAVTNGVFSVELGTNTALHTGLFANASTYLEVQVTPDSVMTPRQQLLMSPGAFRALLADNLKAGDTNYIQVSAVLQASAVFHVASGTVAGPFQVTGTSSFTATGDTTYGITTSTGIRVQAGTLRVEGAGGAEISGNVRSSSITAVTGLLLPQGSAQSEEGAMRWDATANVVYVGTGTSNKTLADTDSSQTLTNKTLNSTGGNVVDATHLRTRQIDNAAPSEGMTFEWNAGTSKWEPVYNSTVTVAITPSQFGAPATLAAGAVAVDTLYLVPFSLPGTMSVNQMRYRVGTAVASSTGDVGIYNASGYRVANGGTDAASFTTAGVTVVAMQGAPVTLQPGQYYFALSARTASPRPFGYNNANYAGMIKGLGTLSCGGAGCGATLPASISLGSITDAGVWVFMSANQ